jgi:Ras-related protein Rab-5C
MELVTLVVCTTLSDFAVMIQESWALCRSLTISPWILRAITVHRFLFNSDPSMNSLLSDLPAFKLVLLGDSGVGKTSIVQFFERQFFDPTIDSTIGAAFVAREIETKLGTINLHIWDTAGQERYRSLVSTYGRGAACALLVFDRSVRTTFESADHWFKECSHFDNENCVLYLVGNKSDLDMAIDNKEVTEWADGKDITFFSVSAKTGDGINAMFQSIAEEIAGKRSSILHQFTKSAFPEVNGTQGKQACC